MNATAPPIAARPLCPISLEEPMDAISISQMSIQSKGQFLQIIYEIRIGSD